MTEGGRWRVAGGGRTVATVYDLIFTHKFVLVRREKFFLKVGMATEEQRVEWAREEFGQARLKDPRQIRRLEKIAGDFMKRPQGSINAASGDSAASKAAYRFFASEIE